VNISLIVNLSAGLAQEPGVIHLFR
jgi:hypothetical protein